MIDTRGTWRTRRQSDTSTHLGQYDRPHSLWPTNEGTNEEWQAGEGAPRAGDGGEKEAARESWNVRSHDQRRAQRDLNAVMRFVTHAHVWPLNDMMVTVH